jgi:broad specificity phosphatase PhoE
MPTLQPRTMSAAEGDQPLLRFYFVRHGESANNVIHKECKEAGEGHLFTRRRLTDPPLTAKGEAQVQLAAARLARETATTTGSGSSARVPSVVEIWTAYLQRAVATAGAVHKAIPTAVVCAKQGIFEVGGMYQHEVVEAVPAPAAASEDGNSGGPTTTEPIHTFRGRPGTTNAELRAAFPFVGQLDEACDDGWYPWTERETLAQAKARAATLVLDMEQAAKAQAALARSCVPAPSSVAGSALVDGTGGGSSSRPPPPPAVVVITHGDFLQLVLAAIAERYGVQPPRSGGASAAEDPEHVAVQNTSVSLVEFIDAAATPTACEEVPPSRRLTVSIPYVGDAAHLIGSACEALVGS